jgi:hypothetical protein
LAVLVAADNGFLVSLGIMYLGFLKIDIINTSQLVCKLNIFLSYISSFLSIWCVTFYNIERFVTVFYPFREFMISGQNISKLAIAVLFGFAMLIYSFAIVTSQLEAIEGGSLGCTTGARWIEFVKAFSLVDIFLSIIIPFLIIILVNCMFSYKLIKKAQENQGGEGEGSKVIKSKDKVLFIKKQIFQHKLLYRKSPLTKTSRACSIQPSLTYNPFHSISRL